MGKTYNIENIEDTHSIITEALNGTTEFIFKTDDVNKILSKYGLNIEAVESLLKSSYQEWFEIANDNTSEYYKEITKFLKSFIERIEVLRNRNKNLYKELIKIFSNNPEMTDKEIWDFKWPKLKFDDENFEIS